MSLGEAAALRPPWRASVCPAVGTGEHCHPSHPPLLTRRRCPLDRPAGGVRLLHHGPPHVPPALLRHAPPGRAAEPGSAAGRRAGGGRLSLAATTCTAQRLPPSCTSFPCLMIAALIIHFRCTPPRTAVLVPALASCRAPLSFVLQLADTAARLYNCHAQHFTRSSAAHLRRFCKSCPDLGRVGRFAAQVGCRARCLGPAQTSKGLGGAPFRRRRQPGTLSA